MYETREEANANARGNQAVIQVDGGYKITPYHMFQYLISEEAGSLFDGGWRSTDKLELMQTYDFDEEHAETICEELKDIETL